uniref:Uncharacterized protein n=1 Tax=Aegilops tauschii subsp. strangulata TaxID=200361 RepID=A0A453NV39_AEGTS
MVQSGSFTSNIVFIKVPRIQLRCHRWWELCVLILHDTIENGMLILEMIFLVMLINVHPVLYSILCNWPTMHQSYDYTLKLSIFRAHVKSESYCLCLTFLQAKTPNYSSTLKEMFPNLEQIDSDMLA